jgi:hypothetical protein
LEQLKPLGRKAFTTIVPSVPSKIKEEEYIIRKQLKTRIFKGFLYSSRFLRFLLGTWNSSILRRYFRG